MFAVIETGGKQYTVRAGEKIKVETLPVEENGIIYFPRVLLVSDGDKTEIGTPFLDTAVKGKVISHGRGDKIRVFKMKSKKRYKRTKGHRQNFSLVEILEIGGKGAPEVKKPVAKKEEPVAKAKATKDEKPKVVKKEAPAKKAAPQKKTAPKKAPVKK